MFGYILRRLITGLLVLVTVSIATFALFFYGPADPALAYCPETRCNPARLETIRTTLGLDEPAAQQYGRYMKEIVTGGAFELGSISIDCPAPAWASPSSSASRSATCSKNGSRPPSPSRSAVPRSSCPSA